MKFVVSFLCLSTLFACQTTGQHEKTDKASHEEINEQDVLPAWEISVNDTHCFPVDNDAFDHPIDQMSFPIAPHDSIWPRIQAGLEFEYVDEKSVRQQLNWYVKHPKYFERVQKRASRYLHYIVKRMHEEGVPYDLALLPIVESAYEPFAYSHGQASGLWQFIPGTGKRFHMDQNWWYDGRRDIVDSTEGAIRYLKYLHRYFDEDWLLAIAAYNSGEGTVGRAIKRNKKKGLPTDFWHLELPKETSAYVPKMIALSAIFQQPEKHGIRLIDIPNKPYFSAVALDYQVDLSQAAKLADISIDELYYLNPGLNRWATPPSKKYDLKLPIDKAGRFAMALKELPEEERVTWHRHTIKSGESLSGIAAKYNSSTQLIKNVNKLRNNNIIAGKTLMVPKASSNNSTYLHSEAQRLSKRQSIKPQNGKHKIQYYVQEGDSWWKIANQYKVDTKSLARWNGKSPKDTLRVGEKLVLWLDNKQAAANNQRAKKIRKVNYRVRQGDSLARVADKFNVKINDVIRWNGIDPKKYIQPGQGLILYVDVMETYQ